MSVFCVFQGACPAGSGEERSRVPQPHRRTPLDAFSGLASCSHRPPLLPCGRVGQFRPANMAATMKKAVSAGGGRRGEVLPSRSLVSQWSSAEDAAAPHMPSRAVRPGSSAAEGCRRPVLGLRGPVALAPSPVASRFWLRRPRAHPWGAASRTRSAAGSPARGQEECSFLWPLLGEASPGLGLGEESLVACRWVWPWRYLGSVVPSDAHGRVGYGLCWCSYTSASALSGCTSCL